MMQKGTLFIISSPSGAGKSSLIRSLLSKYNSDGKMYVSISHTTRSMRPGEQDGVDYHFISEEEFKKMVEKDSFYEWAGVFGKYYGTSKYCIQEKLNNGVDVFLDIDWQGARQIRKQEKNVKSIFILPPSLEELERRLYTRNQDSKEVIEMRMSKAKSEMSHYDEYDYCIINDNFDESLEALRAIVVSTRYKLQYQKDKNNDIISKLL
ncbi:MAG: guanylate kinase [Succinivibrionaceae bacterium]